MDTGGISRGHPANTSVEKADEVTDENGSAPAGDPCAVISAQGPKNTAATTNSQIAPTGNARPDVFFGNGFRSRCLFDLLLDLGENIFVSDWVIGINNRTAQFQQGRMGLLVFVLLRVLLPGLI